MTNTQAWILKKKKQKKNQTKKQHALEKIDNENFL